jgi:hypothetical protein
MMDSTENQVAVNRLKAGMPSLRHLEGSLRSKRDLGKVLGLHGQPISRGRQLADGYVRLVEKTVLEFEASRDTLIVFLSEGYADQMFRSQDHFESCVQSMHKAILFLDRLRHLDLRRADGSSFVPRPRDLVVLREDVKIQVRHMRDTIEHLDEDILKNKLSESALIGVHMGWDKASIGNYNLAFADVASWIEILHGFAKLLSNTELVVSGERTP